MDALVEAIQNVVTTEPETEAQPEPTHPDDGAIETQLTRQISTLWVEHTRLSADRKATARDLRQIRAILAERLFAMKSVLSRPGRGGQWRSCLKERGINRSTADRLVARHAETLTDENGNVPSGAISESAAMTAENLARVVWSRFRKVFATEESVIQFIGRIAELSGVHHERCADGLLIFNPVPTAADLLPGSGAGTDLAPQPPGGDANSADAPAEVAAGTPATEQVAGVGGDHAEAVA